MFDRGVIHVGVVILSISTVCGIREEWFMLMLYCLQLLFTVWRRCSCCWRYLVYHCFLRFDRGVVQVGLVILSTITVHGLIEKCFMLWLLYCNSLLFMIWQRGCSCCCCYIVYHYCWRYDRGVVYVVVILSTITV